MWLDYSKYSNEEQLELDLILYGGCAKDVNGKRLDFSRIRLGEDLESVYYLNNKGEPEKINATIKIKNK